MTVERATATPTAARSQATAVPLPPIPKEGTPKFQATDALSGLAKATTAKDGHWFNHEWKRLSEDMKDQGVRAPGRPWTTWNTEPMAKAVADAAKQPGFKPVGQKAIAAAQSFERAAASLPTDPNYRSNLNNSISLMKAMVQQQAFAAPKEIETLTAKLQQHWDSTVPLTDEQHVALAKQLSDAIRKYDVR